LHHSVYYISNEYYFVGNIMKMKPMPVILKIIFIISILFMVSCQPTGENTLNTPLPTPTDEQTSSNQIIDETIQEDGHSDSINGKIPRNLEIDFWHPWAGETAEIAEELVDKFNRENPWAITINSNPHADQDVLIEDLTEAFINKEQIPDLIVSTSQSLQAWYAGGYSIKEMGPFIRSDDESSSKQPMPEILPIFWNVDVVDEIRIGIPAYQSGHFLFYNQTWGSDLGFEDVPRTIEAFTEHACAAAKNNRYDAVIENNGTGGWIYSREGLSLLSWLRVFGGGDLINSRSQPILTEPENINAFSFLNDLYLNDCAWRSKEPQPYAYFSNRLALFYSGQMEDIVKQIKSDNAYGNTDKWVLIPYPSTFEKPVVMVEGLSYAITTEDEERSIAAWEFIKWMLTSENQSVFVEKTGTFPLSSEVIKQVDIAAEMYTVWKDSLQYLPYAQTEPSFEEWYAIEKVLEDIGWQLTQYTVQSESIPVILSDAEVIVGEFE